MYRFVILFLFVFRYMFHLIDCLSFQGVALKRSLEERGASGCGPEAKKMAGGQAAPGVLGANPNAVTEEWSVPDKMVGLIIGEY